MARTDPLFNLRIPLELKTQLEIRAKDSGRSITAEIIKLIEEGISADNTLKEMAKKFSDIQQKQEFLDAELAKRDEGLVLAAEALKRVSIIEKKLSAINHPALNDDE